MSTPDAPVPPPDSGVRFVDRLFASRLMVEHLLRASVLADLLAAADAPWLRLPAGHKPSGDLSIC